jgi:CHAT domain-containing protein/Tfp pilus assembly protein PilF
MRESMRKVFPALLFLCVLLVNARGSLSAPTFEELFKKGQEAYAAKQYDAAVSYFLQVSDMLLAAKQPAKAQLVLGSNVAVIQLQQEKFADSLATYEKAMALPGKPEEAFLIKAYRNLAVIHGKLGNNAQKALELEKLVKAASKTPPHELSDIHASLGDTYRELELYGKAAGNYEKAKSLLPSDAKPEVRGRILTALGLCQGNVGDFRQAEANLKMAYDLSGIIKQPQTQAEASSNIGILQWERGDYAEAAKRINAALDIEKASKLRRNEGVDSNNLGLVLKSAGRYPESTKYFEQAIVIAKEVGNKKDEAIAFSNRALAARIQGHLKDARKDYQAALAIYDEVKFEEGRASTLLGLGKISEVEDHDFAQAIALYKEAQAIYEKLGLLGSKAEALNQVGRVLRKTATPKRTTRDLVFDDSDEAKVKFPPLDPKTAISESLLAYQEALRIGELSGRKEIIWSARQGIGFTSYQSGKLEEALDQYRKAINIVTGMRGSSDQVELLGDFLKGKDDLFMEAIEVCAALYGKTKKQEYLNLQMQYDETLRNEVTKANMTLVQMNYADPKKQDIYKKIVEIGNQQQKASSSIPLVKDPSKDAKPEAKAEVELRKEEASQAKARVTILEKSYNDLLAEWRKQYPGDAVMFDSNAKVDTAKIQANIGTTEALVQYIQLPDQLIILTITKEAVNITGVDVDKKIIVNLVRDKFVYGDIQIGAKNDDQSKEAEASWYKNCLGNLRTMAKYFVDPVWNKVSSKKRIYIVAGGYLSHVPFAALVLNNDYMNSPVFLVEKVEISNIRLSFFDNIYANKNQETDKIIIAVGNPRNKEFKLGLKTLPAAEKEVRNIITTLGLDNSEKANVKYKNDATEKWWRESVLASGYSIMYFATHGMPYSDTYYSYNIDPQIVSKLSEKSENEWKKQKRYLDKNIPGISHLNGYLYLETSDDGDDGLLTIKEIIELPDKAFSKTKYVILSACNTAVSFAPKSFADATVERALSAQSAEEEMRKAGWAPGIDQVSFVDSFMRRGVSNVYGTLWFADDKASAYLMTEFVKNLQGTNAISALQKAQLTYISKAKSEESPLSNGYTHVPLHPFFWAVGTMFGK